MWCIRLILLSCLALSTSLTGSCQYDPDISKTKQRFLKFDSAHFSYNFKLPFYKIEILDYRFDTTKIGYAEKRTDTRLEIKGGLQQSFGAYLNNYFKNNLDPASSVTLLIVVKKLWLEYGATNQILHTKKIDFSSLLSYLPKNTVCLANMDVFIGSADKYQALIRVDHNFSIEQEEDKDDLSLLLMPFDSLMRSIQSTEIEMVLQKKKNFSTAEIHSGYRSRFELPGLTEQKLARGIFLTFEDFKNNKVTYPDFKWKKTKQSMDVLIKQSGEEIVFIDYWGFFDGKDLYIKPNLMPFKTVRQGNTFDLYANMRNENYNYHLNSPSNILTASKAAINVGTPSFISAYPLQVDMETGKVY